GVPQHDLRWEAVRSATYRGISRETASFLIEKITEDKATAWWRNSFSPRKQHDMHEAILKGAVLGGGQAGLLDVFIDSAARRKEVLDALLKATDDEAQRVAHMQSLLASPRTTP